MLLDRPAVVWLEADMQNIPRNMHTIGSSLHFCCCFLLVQWTNTIDKAVNLQRIETQRQQHQSVQHVYINCGTYFDPITLQFHVHVGM